MTASQDRVRIRACIVAIVCSAGTVAAQTPPSAPADCHAIATPMERLACYDSVSGRAPAALPAPGTSARSPTSPSDTTSDAGKVSATSRPSSMIDAAWGFSPSSPRYDISFYQPNYLLFARYSDRVNTAPFVPFFQAFGPEENFNDIEAKFQFSFKARLWTTDDRRWGVWAAYTQQSQWQVYNGDASRPFRDTNYMPEALVSYAPGVDLGGGFRWSLINGGYIHQSNGRSDVLSRSWNRLFAEVGVERGNLALLAKAWYRIKENSDEDDNPDITDFLGYGQVSALYRWRDHIFSGTVRGNVATGKGAIQLGWNSPPLLGPLRGYVQFFSGYGESLIDYNWKQTTIGAGVSLSYGL